MEACRLFVYLARSAPAAVVLRRGPTGWARLSVWDTSSDRFEHGQWLHGRVYERRSDLAPDGCLFAAFVRQTGRGGAVDSWVALSRPPYFTALAVWSAGGTYHTGPCFLADGRLWLGFREPSPPDVGAAPSSLEIAPSSALPYTDKTNNWTERTVHFNRLLRDGWTLVESDATGAIWQRPRPGGGFTLEMTQRLGGFGGTQAPYLVDVSIEDADGARRPLGVVTWADWDQRGRLILAREGRLVSIDLLSGQPTELMDFNPQSPDPQPAPDWVRIWPG
jgi:hypothetical protein